VEEAQGGIRYIKQRYGAADNAAASLVLSLDQYQPATQA
jgi:hypothetical protein